jgi:hypothetical protein
MNPQEMRLALLQLAKTIVESQAPNYDNDGRYIHPKVETADVIATARKMQAFVNDDGKQPRS